MGISSLDVTQDQEGLTEDAYLYWFSSGNGHHTPRHSTRHFWMALDSLVDGKQHRWAFVSILIHTSNEDAKRDVTRRFTEELTRMIYLDKEQT